MPTPFKDHFSTHSPQYRDHRPHYPAELFEFLAHSTARRDTAWDCGCGNGQAALGLTPWFERVIATDASAGQIAAALPHHKVTYRVAPAEASGLPSASVDLLSVAQAAHWFDFEPFYAEVARVVRPGGVVALFGYGLTRVADTVDPLVRHLYDAVVGPFWPPERHHVEAGYHSLPFPFRELAAPPLHMAAAWDLEQFLGYLGTWSAVQRYRRERGADPLAALRAPLAAAWGSGPRPVTWPVVMRLGVV